MPRLFVYGTLKRGERNDARLASARYIGPAATRDASFVLAEYASVSRPGARTPELHPDGSWRIAGELYEVTPAMLAELDAFERVGRDYERRTVPLAGGGQAEIYLRASSATRPPLEPPLYIALDGNLASWSEPLSA